MKKIHIIETVKDGLRTIKPYLADAHMNYAEYSSVPDSINSGEAPALLILLVDKNPEQAARDMEAVKMNSSFSMVPRLMVLPFNIEGRFPNEEIIDYQSTFQLPVDRGRFISVVSKLLRRSPRRVFRILISLQTEESNVRYSGISVDFSETGIAFESSADFSKGQIITVNFVNPKNRKRFSLKAEVIRRASTQPGGTSFYGVGFRDMTEKDILELKKFLLGED